MWIRLQLLYRTKEYMSRSWQRKRKHRSYSKLAGHFNFATVSVNNSLYNCKAHAGSLHAVALTLPSVEFVEDERFIKVVYAASAICNACYQKRSFYFCADEYRLLIIGILSGIFKQVAKDLLHQLDVHTHCRQRGRKTYIDRVLLEERLTLCNRFLNDVFHLRRFEPQFDLLRI